MNIIFHIGLHKTATTWLQSIYFSEHKEINLINDYISPWNDPAIRYLVKTPLISFDKDYFKELVSKKVDKTKINVISAERLSGHPFSGGFDRYEIANKISQSFPDAKILITIRNQGDILLSTYQQLVKEGYTGKIDDLLDNNCWKTTCFNEHYLNYYELFKIYNEFYSKKSIKFLLFEDFINNFDSFLENIQQFMDVNSKKFNNQEKINTTSRPSNILIKRLLNIFKKTEYNHFPIIRINPKVLRYIVIFLQYFIVNKKISFDKNKFTKKFYASNKKLFNEFDIEFKGTKYEGN